MTKEENNEIILNTDDKYNAIFNPVDQVDYDSALKESIDTDSVEVDNKFRMDGLDLEDLNIDAEKPPKPKEIEENI